MNFNPNNLRKPYNPKKFYDCKSRPIDIVIGRVAKVEVVSGVRFMRVGLEIGVGKREV